MTRQSKMPKDEFRNVRHIVAYLLIQLTRCYTRIDTLDDFLGNDNWIHMLRNQDKTNSNV